MWTFLVELAAVEDQIAENYILKRSSHGEMPDEAEEKLLKQMILRANLKTI
jgi:hypothetical protein